MTFLLELRNMETSKRNTLIGVAVVALVILYVAFRPSPSLAPEHVGDTGTSTTPAEMATGTTENTSAPTVTQKVPTKTPSGQTTPSPVPTTKTTSSGVMAPEIKKPSGYTNTDPVFMKDLIGKQVVLVNFWTYTSINSLRTIPYINQLHWRYRHKGLTVLNIHTPRFSFEKQKDLVDKAAFGLNMISPIILDNEYATWNAWGVKGWPAQYLVDINGRVAYTHSGEGAYETMEIKVEELLAKRAEKLGLPKETFLPFETPAGVSSVDLAQVKSAETYFGSSRNSALGNGTALMSGMQDMKQFTNIELGKFYLTGTWDFAPEYAKSSREGAHLHFRYSAKNVYMVLGSLKMNKLKILVDGLPLTVSTAGKDVRIENDQSYVYVTDKRVYDLVAGKSYGEHTIELVSDQSGLEAYVMMFG